MTRACEAVLHFGPIATTQTNGAALNGDDGAGAILASGYLAAAEVGESEQQGSLRLCACLRGHADHNPSHPSDRDAEEAACPDVLLDGSKRSGLPRGLEERAARRFRCVGVPEVDSYCAEGVVARVGGEFGYGGSGESRRHLRAENRGVGQLGERWRKRNYLIVIGRCRFALERSIQPNAALPFDAAPRAAGTTPACAEH
jgi:hypothetical protein